MATATARVDVYKIVTDRICALLAAGTVPWVRGWREGPNSDAKSLATGKPYRGVNRWLLNPGCHGYTSPLWGTFAQMKKHEWTVKKGEKSMPAVFWKFWEKKDATGTVIGKIPMLRYYSVFNVQQTDAPEEAWGVEKVPGQHAGASVEPPAVLSRYLARQKIRTIHGGDRAFYRPSDDTIGMPSSTAFITPEDYWATYFHEAVHSTAATSRLNRPLAALTMSRGSYATEELIAEVGANMLMSACRLSVPVDNSAAYIAGWLKALGNDPKMVVQAASKAEAAAEYILGGDDAEDDGDGEETDE